MAYTIHQKIYVRKIIVVLHKIKVIEGTQMSSNTRINNLCIIYIVENFAAMTMNYLLYTKTIGSHI